MISDWRNVPIEVGAIVVYPSGSSGYNKRMVEGKVIEISERPIGNRTTPWYNYHKIKLQIIRSSDKGSESRTQTINQASTLERMTVIERAARAKYRV